jgi:two-component system alkaline phosphatase synthesis response regulator PhoP
MSSAGYSILVVDDDPDFVEYTRIVLESQGYHVKTAATADSALRMMREDKPDLVLLDVMMSYVLDGLNVTRQMRDDPELRKVPVIMISAIVSREEAGVFPTDEYLAVDAFMTKPVDPADLLRQVARLLEGESSPKSS